MKHTAYLSIVSVTFFTSIASIARGQDVPAEDSPELESGEPWLEPAPVAAQPPEPAATESKAAPPPAAAAAPPKARPATKRPVSAPRAADATSKAQSAHTHPHHHDTHGWHRWHGCKGAHHCGHKHGHAAGGSRSFALTLGKGNLDMPLLAERMEAAGYVPLSDRVWLLGLEGTRTFAGGLVLGLGAQFYRSSETPRRDASADATLRGGALHAKLGHTLVDTKRWLVYPALTIGGYHNRLDLDASGEASFDAVLGDPARGAELRQGGAFVGGVLAIDKRFGSHSRKGGFWSLGLRLGVTQSIWSSDWH
ncbi:MAG TPA: hypothetical protein PKA88_16955, partial [Polyangiaceae bacterium]|nr:hypothetical protein [Polyangiaceae bacterium]